MGSFVVFHFAFTIIKKKQIKHKTHLEKLCQKTLKPKNTFNRCELIVGTLAKEAQADEGFGFGFGIGGFN